MKLLHASELDDALVQSCPAAAYVRLMSNNPRELINNVSADMYYLQWNGYGFPVSVVDTYIPDNSYVVSIYNTYISYGLQELAFITLPRALKFFLSKIMLGFGFLLNKNQIDKVVYINNWFLSTNLYPLDWQPEQCADLIKLLTQRFKNHAICFRSLNCAYYAKIIREFTQAGCFMLGSRQVYLFDGRRGTETEFLNCKDTKRDIRFVQKGSNTLSDIAPVAPDAVFDNIESLYNALYLDKYSTLNPQFSADWLNHSQQAGLVKLKTLHNINHETIGVIGIFEQHQVMTVPIVGYDTALPQKMGLYRQLMHHSMLYATTSKQWLNLSAGASDFKRFRGGKGEIEYSAVYIKHLPIWRKINWYLLSSVIYCVAVPIMKKFKL